MTPLSHTIASYAFIGLLTNAGFALAIAAREVYARVRKDKP